MKKGACLLLLLLSGCANQELGRSRAHERHVSDPELEAKVRGETYDGGPGRWWGYGVMEWFSKKPLQK